MKRKNKQTGWVKITQPRCSVVKEPLAVHLTQHEQPNCVFTVPQTTQNYDPAQLTQQCVYRNNPALLRVYTLKNAGLFFFFTKTLGSACWVILLGYFEYFYPGAGLFL